jgi:hypothetical protein
MGNPYKEISQLHETGICDYREGETSQPAYSIMQVGVKAGKGKMIN